MSQNVRHKTRDQKNMRQEDEEDGTRCRLRKTTNNVRQKKKKKMQQDDEDKNVGRLK